jgi:uncharacterized membrane protein
MKKNPLPWLAVLIAILPLGYLALIWDSLPQTVPLRRGFDMQVERYGNKSELWIAGGIMSAVSVLVYFLLVNIHRFDPKRKDGQQSSIFHKLAFGLLVFIAAIHFLVISSVKGESSLQNLLFPLLGAMFAFLGNYMVNIKPNYFAGFRLPWTLSNDENWRKTHHLGGRLWFAGGMLIAVVCLFLPPGLAFAFFMAILLVMIAIPVIYSYRLFKKQP